MTIDLRDLDREGASKALEELAIAIDELNES